MPILKDLEQEEKYEMRLKNLEMEFKWTQGQIEKLRALNSGLLKKAGRTCLANEKGLRFAYAA